MNLNQSMRLDIQTRILDASFKAELDKIAARKIALMDEIYLSEYGEYLPFMAKLPKHAFGLFRHLSVNAFGYQPSKDDGWVMSECRHQYPYHTIILNNDISLYTQMIQLRDDAESLRVRIFEATAHIKGILASVRTVEKLNEVWPESIPYTKNLVVAKPGLPMIQITELNAKLGLPHD